MLQLFYIDPMSDYLELLRVLLFQTSPYMTKHAGRMTSLISNHKGMWDVGCCGMHAMTNSF